MIVWRLSRPALQRSRISPSAAGAAASFSTDVTVGNLINNSFSSSSRTFTSSSHNSSSHSKLSQEEKEAKIKAHISHLKNPIVHQLWTSREAAKALRAGEKESLPLEQPRAPKTSVVEIDYPFAEDPLLQETYRNAWGQVRFGRILEDLDALAGNIAFAHVLNPTVNIVTASVDRIDLTTAPSLENNQHLQGKVTYVGTSSMEIRMECIDQATKETWMEGKSTLWLLLDTYYICTFEHLCSP